VAAERNPKARNAHAVRQRETPSKQKRRQRQSTHDVERASPTIDDTHRLTHQCTNWELVRTGQDECLPTVEQ
jgi:hypothetical protein